jgi:HAMP domain-containing protein
MSNAAARWKAVQRKLAAIERAIDEVSQQRLICYVTDPLAFEHSELLQRREAVEAELRALARHVGVTVLVPRTSGKPAHQ